MKVSIITISLNSSNTIRETIESVLCQTYANIEYIIIDGKSTDGTIDIIKNYESIFEGRLKYISEPDNGLYDALNKGIKLSTGDIIGILNSDDYFIDSEVVVNIANAFETHKIDAVYGNLLFVKKYNTSMIVRKWVGSFYKNNSFKVGWHPAHPTFYVKREIYEIYGLYDTSLGVSADFELMLRFIEKYKISTYYLDRYFIKMRMGGESTGSIKKIIKGNMNILKAFKKNEISVTPFCYLLLRLVPKMINIVRTKIKL
jgi:glycosyltransferase involved in cell wall biosynthesis